MAMAAIMEADEGEEFRRVAQKAFDEQLAC